LLLTKISQIIIDNENVQGLIINPALVSDDDIRILDVSVNIAEFNSQRHLAIRPYPKELEEPFVLRSGREVLLRPIRPEDEATHQEFDNALNKEDRYKRYFGERPRFSHEQMARLTQIDYEREMAFIATAKTATGFETLGVVRAQRDFDNVEAEFAIAIRSDLKNSGLGTRLLEKMVNYCRDRGTQELKGFTMLENSGMANLARKLGFTVQYDRDEGVMNMHMVLNKPNDIQAPVEN
jgi:acetyltransferase